MRASLIPAHDYTIIVGRWPCNMCMSVGSSLLVRIFWARSCLAVNSDSLHICTETASITLEILRAKSDSGVSYCLDETLPCWEIQFWTFMYRITFSPIRSHAPSLIRRSVHVVDGHDSGGHVTSHRGSAPVRAAMMTLWATVLTSGWLSLSSAYLQALAQTWKADALEQTFRESCCFSETKSLQHAERNQRLEDFFESMQAS
jgi:hypothetical protein